MRLFERLQSRKLCQPTIWTGLEPRKHGPVLSIPDQGPVILSLALDELVEILSKCLDSCSRRSFGERLKLTLTEISISAHPATLLIPLLKKNVLRFVEKVVSNIITSCHFYPCVCE